MGFRWTNEEYAETVEGYSSHPETSFVGRWVFGVIVPVCVAWYGVSCCLSGEALLFGKAGSTLALRETQAVVMGVAWIFGALFLHFHFFWSSFGMLCRFADMGKFLSLLGGVGAFGYVLFTIFVRFW